MEIRFSGIGLRLYQDCRSKFCYTFVITLLRVLSLFVLYVNDKCGFYLIPFSPISLKLYNYRYSISVKCSKILLEKLNDIYQSFEFMLTD